MTGSIRDRYEPLEVIGEGGEGRVVKALDHQHDRLVALKIREVRLGSEREDLLAEARILLKVPPHEHLPLVREDFFDGDSYIVAMDWVEGTDLAQLLRAQGRPGLPPSSVMRWLSDAASALTHLQTSDEPVIHGDVKPANLILTRGGRVVLVDFGLSSAPYSPRRRAGTRGYAAPELMSGELPSRASDIYSLAATAFALLTGAPPSGIRPSWDGIAPGEAEQLEEVLRLGLATDPKRRPGTPGEFVERLRAGWGQTLPTGVLTFCMTDIEGSTVLWDTHPEAMARALVRHDELISRAVEVNGGRFIKSMGEGDATVSVFIDPSRAVHAALEMNRRFATEAWTGDLDIRIRTALHTGEADRRDESYFGPPLNVVARIRGLGNGGEVLLSKSTADLVRGRLPSEVSLIDLGPHRLRGVSESEQVFAIAAPGVVCPRPATACPYPGLLAFQPDDHDLFFGREDVVEAVTTHLRENAFVAVVGSSGNGKSSVLRAGLAPTDRDAVVATPGADPQVPDVDGLLIIDQFEELFTLCRDENRRQRFIDALLARSDPVAIGLRADFYGACADHAGLAAAISRHQVLLGPMTADELRRAIVEPAHTSGLRVEPGLVDVLVAEVAGEPGALPLLAHALHATWERRDGRTLTLGAYHETGGVRGAIAATADRVIDELAPDDRELARQMFLRLVEPGDAVDTRRRAAIAELGGDRAGALLHELSDARLVTVDGGSVEVAHEALIREWPRFRAWIDDAREGLRVHRHVTASASAWDSLGRDPAELYRGPRLAAAIDWLASDPDLSPLERSFIDESRVEADRVRQADARANRRLRSLLVGAAIALIVALIAGSVAFISRERAADARDRADISRIAAVSREVTERRPDLGILLAAEAYRLRDDPETRGTLLASIETHPQLAGLIHGSGSGLEAAIFSPDGKMLATPTSDGSGTLLWDTTTHERVGVFRRGKDLILGGSISPDGSTLVVPVIRETRDGFTSAVQTWNVKTRRFIREVESPAGALTSAMYSDDGRLVVTQGGPTLAGAFPTIAVLWDPKTWKPIGEPWSLVDTYVGDRKIALSPNGRLLASPTPEGAVRVWRVDDRAAAGEPIQAVEIAGGLASEVTALAFTPDGSTLAIALDSGPIVLVDPVTRELRTTLSQESGATSMEWSRDGSLLAVGRGDGRTLLFDAEGTRVGLPLAANAAAVNDVSFSPDGSLLATAGVDRTGAVWSLDGTRTIGTPLRGQRGAITQIRWTDDGRTAVTSSSDGTVAIRDPSGHVRRTIRMPGEVQSVAVDDRRRRLIAGGTAGSVRSFSLDGRPERRFDLGKAWSHAVAVDPRTGIVAVAVDNERGNSEEAIEDRGHVRFWDPESNREVGPRIASEHQGTPVDVAWTPDGALIAVTFDSNILRLYAGTSHRARGDAIEIPDEKLFSIAFSPDGKKIAAGSSAGVVRQWSVATHKELGSALRGHTADIAGIAYSHDGRFLATTTLYAQTRLWDAETGASLGGELVAGRVPYTERTFAPDHFFPSRPAFSPDGMRLMTAGPEGAGAVWDLRPEVWLRSACAMTGRDLTRTEWDRYLPGRKPEAVCRPPRQE